MRLENKMKKPLMFLIAFLFITITSSAQDKDYTDGKGNGYFWLSLNINYNSPLYNPKYDLLNIMLIHYNWQKNAWNEDYLIDCRDEITRLLSEDKTESTSFDTVIEKIDSFYTDQRKFTDTDSQMLIVTVLKKLPEPAKMN